MTSNYNYTFNQQVDKNSYTQDQRNSFNEKPSKWPPLLTEPPPTPPLPTGTVPNISSNTSINNPQYLNTAVPPPTIQPNNGWQSVPQSDRSFPPPRLPHEINFTQANYSTNFVPNANMRPYSQQYFPNYDPYNYGSQRNNDGSDFYPGYPYENRNPYMRRGHPLNNNRPYRRPPYFRTSTPAENVPDMPVTRIKRKGKKPLSQNNPGRRDWSVNDIVQALLLERELNKKPKDHSLIIKFPDHELNKDIVSAFHPSIENVHFQQPSTPRFCFVTLKESADPDAVIAELNKRKFGDGYITAEYKREETSNNSEDIDPLTLYVGNLAQDITKENMHNLYPNSKRIDIGFAKKMKFTRYAFVRFHTSKDALEAFKRTHNMEINNKSLIVRFRRLNGPIGMPGESKPQNSPSKNSTQPSEDLTSSEVELTVTDEEQVDVTSTTPSNIINEIWSETNYFEPLAIKKETNASSESEEEKPETKPDITKFKTPFAKISIDEYVSRVKPIKIKTEVKQEKDDTSEESRGNGVVCETGNSSSVTKIKTEVVEHEDSQMDDEMFECEEDDDDFDPFTPNFSEINRSWE